MITFTNYHPISSHLADLLPWAALVGAGLVLNKDGSFQRTARAIWLRRTCGQFHCTTILWWRAGHFQARGPRDYASSD